MVSLCIVKILVAVQNGFNNISSGSRYRELQPLFDDLRTQKQSLFFFVKDLMGWIWIGSTQHTEDHLLLIKGDSLNFAEN